MDLTKNKRTRFAAYIPLFLYAFFGVCTTGINIAAYWLLYTVLGASNVGSTVVAWLVANIFAFVTNKFWVFGSKSTEKRCVLYELLSFFLCRLGTGLLDVAVMWLTVDKFDWNSMLWKAVSNVIVIVLNYVASKLFIFKRGTNTDDNC